MRRVTVLYVAGTGRSGSTLLGNMLGEVPGFFSAGEINNLFRRGLIENWYCGCGERFNSCPTWRAVLAYVYPDEGVAPREMVRIGTSLTRIRRLPRLLRYRGDPEVLGDQAADYLRQLDRLYVSLQASTGAEVIVDTSKSPAYGYVLGMLPSVDLHVVHLIRDPRGTAFSWRRKRLRTDGADERHMQTMSPLKAAALWSIWNLSAEAMWTRSPVPYRLMRYEDLVADPRATLRAALSLVGAPDAELEFVEGGRVTLGAHHTVSGNPMRLSTGSIELTPDLEWVRDMAVLDRFVVTALTAHSLRRYGYPIRPAQQLSLSRRS